MIMMPYTPPYYLDQMEQCGMAKAKDLYAYITVIKEVSAGDRLERLASAIKAKGPGSGGAAGEHEAFSAGSSMRSRKSTIPPGATTGALSP